MMPKLDTRRLSYSSSDQCDQHIDLAYTMSHVHANIHLDLRDLLGIADDRRQSYLMRNAISENEYEKAAFTVRSVAF